MSPQKPHVLVILLDDVGFGHFGSYGSSIQTRHMDALASEGASFTNFHVTALCSPTRASLLTGRNHHAVGMGFLADFDTGHPGYRGTVTKKAATLAEILGEHGYSSYAVGKWHLSPPSEMSPTGPFTTWPTGRGFQRWYGFIGGEDDQYKPDLWYDQHHVPVPEREDYHLSEDLAEKTIEFLSDHVSVDPDRPFYLHLAFGAGHAPHQVPAEYVEKYRGQFDHGWDEERRRVFERQLERGIIPPDTRLPEFNQDVPPWEDLSDDEKRVCARFQEVFAGFIEHTDDQIGRVLSFLEEQDVLDDTLILLLTDNGASGEGGRYGSANEYRSFLGLEETFDEVLAAIDDLGGPDAHHQYPTGWAQVGNTPLRYYKRYAYGGGVRAPLIMRYPRLIREEARYGGFHHVTDIVPTILDVVGVEAPQTYRGVPQMPMHGESFSESLQGLPPATRKPQYFETAGFRGLYWDGWKIVANHRKGDDFSNDQWELYCLPDDFSETHDLAAERPEKVAEMVAEWWRQAEQYSVLPLDDRGGERAAQLNPGGERRSFRLLPGSRLPHSTSSPNFGYRPFEITARIDGWNASDEGVLLAYGRQAAGFVLFVQNGRLCFDLNLAGRHTLVTSDDVIQEGARELGVRLRAEGTGSRIDLVTDGVVVGTSTAPGLMPVGFGTMATQVGFNAPSAVSREYKGRFPYSGTLRDVQIELGDRITADSTNMQDAWMGAQ